MERKTNVHARDNTQEILITREFELPRDLLFKAYAKEELVEQWMGNKVLKMYSEPFGSYAFETRDQKGNLLFSASGTIHEFIPNERITRTFKMENTPFPVQLEFLEFEELSHNTSKLTIHIIYKNTAVRDQMLQMPFAEGINMAHNQLEKIMTHKI